MQSKIQTFMDRLQEVEDRYRVLRLDIEKPSYWQNLCNLREEAKVVVNEIKQFCMAHNPNEPSEEVTALGEKMVFVWALGQQLIKEFIVLEAEKEQQEQQQQGHSI